MRRVPLVPILVIFVLILGLIIAYWALTPRLSHVSPIDGATAVPAGTSLRLEFSQPVREDEVLAHLDIQPAIPGEYTWQDNILVFTPERPWPSGETIAVSLKPGVHRSGFLGLPLRGSASWSFTITQPRLVYLYPHDDPADIYMLDPYSGESQRLTSSPAGIDSFSVGFHGNTIYFSQRDTKGSSSIYRLDLLQQWRTELEINAGGVISEPVLVLDCPDASCRDPVVSPLGDYLAYERVAFGGDPDPSIPQVWLIALDEVGDLAIGAVPTLAGPELHQTFDPTWSSQGLLAYYNKDLSSFVFQDPKSGVQAMFLNQTGQGGDWHPNGREFLAPEINFLGENTSPDLDNLQPLANSHLILFNLDTSNTRNLTQQENLEDTAPSFSPDGAYVVMARKSLHMESWTPGRQLWIMRTGTWAAEALTEDDLYSHHAFAWSPSGELLAYVRFNESVLSEAPELWVMDPFTRQSSQITLAGYSPQWIP